MSTLVLGPRQCITVAGEEYDSGATRTLAYDVAEDRRGRKFRLVESETDWHFEQQLMSYGSGLNFTIDSQQRLEDEVKGTYVKMLAGSRRVHYHIFRFASDVPGLSPRSPGYEAHIYLRDQPCGVVKYESGGGTREFIGYVRIVGDERNETILRHLKGLGFEPLPLEQVDEMQVR